MYRGFLFKTKNMKNKYYTPTLEDFRIGYEFEYNGHYTHIKSDWENR